MGCRAWCMSYSIVTFWHQHNVSQIQIYSLSIACCRVWLAGCPQQQVMSGTRHRQQNIRADDDDNCRTVSALFLTISKGKSVLRCDMPGSGKCIEKPTEKTGNTDSAVMNPATQPSSNSWNRMWNSLIYHSQLLAYDFRNPGDLQVKYSQNLMYWCVWPNGWKMTIFF